MLIEYEISTGRLISATVLNLPPFFTAVERANAISQLGFEVLPETSASCHVFDEEIIENIWTSHKNGGEVIVTVDEVGAFVSAQVEVVAPVVAPAPKTADQLRIEQLESELATANLQIIDIWETILT